MERCVHACDNECTHGLIDGEMRAWMDQRIDARTCVRIIACMDGSPNQICCNSTSIRMHWMVFFDDPRSSVMYLTLPTGKGSHKRFPPSGRPYVCRTYEHLSWKQQETQTYPVSDTYLITQSSPSFSCALTEARLPDASMFRMHGTCASCTHQSSAVVRETSIEPAFGARTTRRYKLLSTGDQANASLGLCTGPNKKRSYDHSVCISTGDQANASLGLCTGPNKKRSYGHSVYISTGDQANASLGLCTGPNKKRSYGHSVSSCSVRPRMSMNPAVRKATERLAPRPAERVRGIVRLHRLCPSASVYGADVDTARQLRGRLLFVLK